MSKLLFFASISALVFSLYGCEYQANSYASSSTDSSSQDNTDYQNYIQQYPGYTWGEEQWLKDFESGCLNNVISFETFNDQTIEPIYCHKGEMITINKTVEINNGSFLGWFFDSDLTKEIEYTFISERNLTLFAKYDIENEELIFNPTPFVNDHGYWVINGDVTEYNKYIGNPSLSSDGYWMLGSTKTDYVAYTTNYEPMKCLDYSTVTTSDGFTDVFAMSDGTTKRGELFTQAYNSIDLVSDTISKQDCINSIPNILLRLKNSSETKYILLDYYRIKNIENVRFSEVGNRSLEVFFFGNTYEFNIEIVQSKFTLSGDEVYDFHSQLQKNFLESDLLDIENYCKGDLELSKPTPYNMEISEQINEYSDLTIFELNHNHFEYTIDYANNAVKLFNFEIEKTYTFFCIFNGLLSNRLDIKVTSKICRNLDIGGLTNCRDIGGKQGKNGEILKQGLFLRTSSLNQSYANAVETLINEKGLKTLTDSFNIQTEVDLRYDDGEHGKYTTSVIDCANYLPCVMKAGRNLPDLEGNEEVIRNLFNNVFSNLDNYPMVVHCSIGVDRTGLITYLLLGVLGCDDQTILKDYLFSNFALVNADRNLRSLAISFTNSLSVYPGDTVNERATNYLLSIGVSQSNLDKISDIFF